jgi:hypothetical protein
LKTGAQLSYSWQSIAVQLAAYSRANAAYVQGAAPDGSQDVRTPLIDVDQDHGLIMWLNAGSGRLELFLVDLQRGWEAFEHSMWTRGWRKTPVSSPLVPDDLTVALEASLAAVTPKLPSATDDTHPVPVVEATAHVPVVAPVAPNESPRAELRAWFAERIVAIGAHPQARQDLARMWPNVPTLKASTDHTDEQLAEIGQVLDLVEDLHSLPFNPPKPEAVDAAVARVVAMFPNTNIHQEQP